MAELSPTAANVAPVNDTQYVARTYIAAAAITAGEALYLNSSGKAAKALATALSTSEPFLGIATHGCGAGSPVEVLSMGAMEGMGVSGQNYGTPIYLSETTAGDLTTTAPSTNTDVVVEVGKVLPMPGPGLEKVLWVQVNLSHLLVVHG